MQSVSSLLSHVPTSPMQSCRTGRAGSQEVSSAGKKSQLQNRHPTSSPRPTFYDFHSKKPFPSFQKIIQPHSSQPFPRPLEAKRDPVGAVRWKSPWQPHRAVPSPVRAQHSRAVCSLPDTLLGDFLLTYTVFMPTSQLCRALLHQYPSAADGGPVACSPSCRDHLGPRPLNGTLGWRWGPQISKRRARPHSLCSWGEGSSRCLCPHPPYWCP